MIPKAMGGDVIVYPLMPEEKIGLIHTPDTIVKRRENQGIVTSVGPDVNLDYLNEEGELVPLTTGNHVMFNAYSGNKLSFSDGGTFLVIPQTHIITVIFPSNVVLLDNKTMKRIIEQRFGELHMMYHDAPTIKEFMTSLEEDLIDRINSITIAEGLEF